MGKKKKNKTKKNSKKNLGVSPNIGGGDVSSNIRSVSSDIRSVSSDIRSVSSDIGKVSSNIGSVSSTPVKTGNEKINKDKFSFVNINDDGNIDTKFREDIEELEVFSDDEKSYQEKRKVFVNLFLKFILTIKKFIELLLNKTADKIEKQETFHLFLWQLKKIILIMNSQNPMKVKNNAF